MTSVQQSSVDRASSAWPLHLPTATAEAVDYVNCFLFVCHSRQWYIRAASSTAWQRPRPSMPQPTALQIQASQPDSMCRQQGDNTDASAQRISCTLATPHCWPCTLNTHLLAECQVLLLVRHVRVIFYMLVEWLQLARGAAHLGLVNVLSVTSLLAVAVGISNIVCTGRPITYLIHG